VAIGAPGTGAVKQDGSLEETPVLTLYSMQRSGNSYKVRLTLARLGIP